MNLSLDLHQHRTNVGSTERWISGLSGGALLAYGVRKKTCAGALTSVLGAAMLHRGVSGYCGVYGLLNIDTAHAPSGLDVGRRRGPIQRLTLIQDAVIIDRPVEEVYRFWRDLSNLQMVVPHLHCVEQHENGRSHWISDILGRKEIHWDALITHERPNRLIAWRTVKGSHIHHHGRVEFIPTGQGGTEVRVTMRYRPPMGVIGAAAGKLLNRSPQSELHEGLRHMRTMIEAGEIVMARGDNAGQCVTPTKEELSEPRSPRRADQAVTQASEESFPASDVPSFNPGHT